jgi:hypothetical protein
MVSVYAPVLETSRNIRDHVSLALWCNLLLHCWRDCWRRPVDTSYPGPVLLYSLLCKILCDILYFSSEGSHWDLKQQMMNLCKSKRVHLPSLFMVCFSSFS